MLVLSNGPFIDKNTEKFHNKVKVTLSYDAIGNPLTWRDGATVTWSKGRQLSSFTRNNKTVSYTYNAEGVRTSKTSNYHTNNYLLSGGTVVQENPYTGVVLTYRFDASGARYAVDLGINGSAAVTYWYLYNAQGDVVGIADKTGAVVARYTYDAWGKVLSITDADGNAIDEATQSYHIAHLNPIRYRGYYYDTETGLYYLQSRYYDPTVGRFVNADGVMGMTPDASTYNLFAYCGNNPVMRSDALGMWFDPFSGLDYWYSGSIADRDRQMQNRPPLGYENRNSTYLPKGGNIGTQSINLTPAIKEEKQNITFVPPDQVKDLLERKGNFAEFSISTVIAAADLKWGTKVTGATILVSETLSGLIDEVEYRRLCDAVDGAAKNGNGLVIFTTYIDDPRVVNMYRPSYAEWTGEFGTYPYADTPWN